MRSLTNSKVRAALVAVICSAFAVAGAACVKAKAEPLAASTEDAGAASEPQNSSAPRAAAPAPPSSAQSYQSIAERFAAEAQNRPGGTPKAEDVYAAFEKQGAKFLEKKQHAAGVYGAKYCLGAKAEQDLHMSVCEYDSEAAVASGKEMSERMFGTVPNRAEYVHKRSLLILRQANKTAASDALAQKLAGAFAKL